MHVFKIYLYKRQTKKRNLFIYLFLLRFLGALVLVFSFFYSFSCAYAYVALSLFKKFSNSKKNFVRLFEIVIVSLM